MISIIIISIITTSITITMIANMLVIIITIISTSSSLIHAVTDSEYCHNYSLLLLSITTTTTPLVNPASDFLPTMIIPIRI